MAKITLAEAKRLDRLINAIRMNIFLGDYPRASDIAGNLERELRRLAKKKRRVIKPRKPWGWGPNIRRI